MRMCILRMPQPEEAIRYHGVVTLSLLINLRGGSAYRKLLDRPVVLPAFPCQSRRHGGCPL